MGETEKTILISILLLTLLPIASATIITGQGSSYTFNITNCYAQPNTSVNCSPSTIFYSCTIQNPAFIDQVEFRIDGTDYTTTQNSSTPSQFYYFYNKPQEYTTNTNPLNLDRERITDVNNKKVNAYELVSITRNCTTCSTTYNTSIVQACNTSNQKITQYLSNNETCSPSYNATETCNYCDPNIETIETACTINGTKQVSYQDLNYTTCCLNTGLTEDCIINTPLYQNTTETCDYLIQDFNCNLDTSPILNKKINVNCELPAENYSCIINTYQEIQNNTNTITSTLLATTPEYKKSSGSLLSLAQESEERTAFTTDAKIMNGYYTTKELRTTNTYKIQVMCNAPNQNTLKYEELVQPTYHTPDQPIYFFIWGGQNGALIFMWIMIISLILAFLFWIIRTYTHNRRYP